MFFLKTKYIQKFLKKKGVKTEHLTPVITDLLKGKGSSLGSSLYKIRMKDEHQGKSGAYRTIWFWKREEMIILCFFFPKNVMGNITPKEKKALKLLAKSWSQLQKHQIHELIELGEMLRIDYDQKNISCQKEK
jgi:hypothetical protein